MDIKSLHREFKVFLDKVDTEALPDFIPSEIDIFLNEAQHRYVNELHIMRNTPNIPSGEQRRIDLILSAITVWRESISLVNKVGDFPSNYLTYVSALVDINSNKIPASIYNHLDGEVDVRDPFNKPTIGYPVIVFAEGKIHLDGTGDKILLTYLRYPNKISYTDNTTCELPDSVHRDIAKKAVSVALETIESQRAQTQR
jgi:hypothetical protein